VDPDSENVALLGTLPNLLDWLIKYKQEKDSQKETSKEQKLSRMAQTKSPIRMVLPFDTTCQGE
jgi:hypothetical protein